jgi:predicted nucleic acid-binding protein
MVPVIWFAETANALLVLERRKKLTRGERAKALSRLGDLNILPDEDGHRFVFSSVSELASKRGLSVYDASYLELAVRRGLPFASRDEAVKAAAEKCGLVVR